MEGAPTVACSEELQPATDLPVFGAPEQRLYVFQTRELLPQQGHRGRPKLDAVG